MQFNQTLHGTFNRFVQIVEKVLTYVNSNRSLPNPSEPLILRRYSAMVF